MIKKLLKWFMPYRSDETYYLTVAAFRNGVCCNVPLIECTTHEQASCILVRARYYIPRAGKYIFHAAAMENGAGNRHLLTTPKIEADLAKGDAVEWTIRLHVDTKAILVSATPANPIGLL